MRLTITILFSCLLAHGVFAQRTDCPDDLVLYPLEKTSSVGDPPIFNVDTLHLNPLLTNGVYQYYEAPQDIVIDGARIHAFKTDNTNGDTVTVTVELRRANNDSIPSSLLASATVLITTRDSVNAPIESFEYDVSWPAVTVSAAYTISVRVNPLGPGVSFLHNNLDGTNSDGNEEWLSGVRQGTSWIRSHAFNVNAQPFDADFFLLPFVDYEINASFINDPECLFDELGDTVHFFNDGASIVDSRMYNKMVFQNTGVPQQWNFGDGSSVLFLQNPSHFYPSNGPFAPSLTVNMLNWSDQTCVSNATQVIKETPEQDFEYSTNNLEVQFENKTVGLFSAISYDYGDGNNSINQQDPFHKYAAPGTYWVCQSMNTSCGEITHCENVAVATNTALNCGKDSVKFAIARATHVKTISIKNTNSLSQVRLFGVGQRFDVTQPIIVHGFSFYANHSGLFRDSYPVECKIWKEGSGTLPSGSPLATSTVRINKVEVDSNYSDSNRYTAIFNRAVSIKEDFVLTLEYDSNVAIQVSLNGYQQGNGQGELKALGKINDTTWVTPASINSFNVNGYPVNADMIFEPLIEYNLDANFTYLPECLDLRDGQESVKFTNNSSPIVGNKIYNQIPFYGSSVQAYEWDFGDSSAISNQINPTYSFQGTGPFDVTLKIIMEGWTSYCESSQTLNVPVYPTAGFDFDQITSEIIFYDSSHNADAYLWTFQDGTRSTLASPIHYYTSIGDFEVCQYVSNVCGSDTLCDTVTISIVGIPDYITKDLKVFPNPASDVINIQAENLEAETIELTLYDLRGRQVRSYSSQGGYINHQWYIGDLARGSYMMKIKADDYEGTRMVVLAQ